MQVFLTPLAGNGYGAEKGFHPNQKYSNRRLYDIAHSRYLRLDELVELIKAEHEVQVIDSKSKEEITQSVLMQMLI